MRSLALQARLAASGLLAIGVAMGCQQPSGPTSSCADLLLVGGNIHTVDAQRSTAHAMAVRGDRILAVGETEPVRASHYCDGQTLEIDLQGKTVIPGLTDAHAHLQSLGFSLVQVDLVGTRSFEEVLDRVQQSLENAAPGEWILGRGWDQNDWPEKKFPTRQALDALSSEHGIALGRVDGHALLVNHVALAAAGIDRSTPDPTGGEILRDEQGDPTGVFVDNAANLIAAVIPDPTMAQKRAAIQAAVKHCLSLGLTGVHDAGISYPEWDLYREMVDQGDLGLRVYAMVGGSGWEIEELFRRKPEIGRGDQRFSVRAIKLYMDGALGSRGAALLTDYSDRPGHRGLLLQPEEEIEAITRRALEEGYQVAVHAIGDRGNRTVLDLYERALGDAPPGDYRLRIEHAQILAPEDRGRFASLGVIPSMQPTHCTSDMPWVPERLGSERTKGGYVWRTLLDAGVEHLPLGSDFPVESADPFLGLYAAVTRQDLQGQPADGWNQEQSLTPFEALRGFTLDAAYASFQESDLGSLEAGKLADFVVLDRDLLSVEPSELPEIEILETWVGGKRAYLRP